MPYDNNKKQNFPVYPSFTYTSISSMEGNNKFLSFDIWNNRTSLTFVEKRDESQKSIKLGISLDKIMILHEILYNINAQRINDYREGNPYKRIEQGIKINVQRGFQNQQKVESEPYLLIYTKPIENIERVCIKGVDGNESIEIILASNNLQLAVSDPNRLANIDLTDIVLSKVVYHLKNLPMILATYKLVVAGFQTFVGLLRRDSATGKIYKSEPNSNGNYNPNYKKQQNINMRPIDNDDISSDDVPF